MAYEKLFFERLKTADDFRKEELRQENSESLFERCMRVIKDEYYYQSGKSIRKNAVYAIVCVMQAIRESKEDLIPSKAKWIEYTHDWIQTAFSLKDAHLLSISGSETEEMIEARIIIVPIMPDGRLCARALLGNATTLSKLQYSFAKDMKLWFGLKRTPIGTIRSDVKYGEIPSSGNINLVPLKGEGETDKEYADRLILFIQSLQEKRTNPRATTGSKKAASLSKRTQVYRDKALRYEAMYLELQKTHERFLKMNSDAIHMIEKHGASKEIDQKLRKHHVLSVGYSSIMEELKNSSERNLYYTVMSEVAKRGQAVLQGKTTTLPNLFESRK